MFKRKRIKILSLLILLFLNINIINIVNGSQIPDIVATVDDTPITAHEFLARRKFIYVMDGHTQPNSEFDQRFNHFVLKTLIDDYLFINQAEKSKMPIIQKDLDEAVSHLESINKMPKGEFIKNLKANNVDINTVMIKLKAQIIHQRIAQALAGNITVNNNEVTQVALLFNKEVSYKLLKLTGLNNTKNIEYKLQKLALKPSQCPIDDTKIKSIATSSEVEYKSSNAPSDINNILPKLKIGEFTPVLHEGSEYSVYILCSKNIAGMNEEEYNQVTYKIANKKVGIELNKYFEKIRNKAHIVKYL